MSGMLAVLFGLAIGAVLVFVITSIPIRDPRLRAEVVKFENGKFGIRASWGIGRDFQFLDNGPPGDSLEWHWWVCMREHGHSPKIRASCEFLTREAAQSKLSRWVAYKNTPSSAINDIGSP